MYHIGNSYYPVVAEGGTKYGHMIAYGRSENVWGPFENYPHNPVLTNRNKAPEIIQGIGHGDLVQKAGGSWYIMALDFRQLHPWQPFHHLGRETFLIPVSFHFDGWFTAGNGTAEASYEIPGSFVQQINRNPGRSSAWAIPNTSPTKWQAASPVLSWGYTPSGKIPLSLQTSAANTFRGIHSPLKLIHRQVLSVRQPACLFGSGSSAHLPAPVALSLPPSASPL